MASLRKAIALVLLVSALACKGSGHLHEEPTSFFDLVLDANDTRYTAASGLAEMTRFSELVVVGTMRAVKNGGTALGSSTVVAQLQVSRVLKGSDADGHVYVEIRTGPLATVDKLNGVLPQGAGLWFLQDAVASASSPLDEGRGEGLPPGETLYAAASPQGLLMESDGELVQPLESDPALWLADIERYVSLSQAGEAVEEAAREASF
jgi:hypothetical protein